MENLELWWNALSSIQQLYWAVAIVSSLAFLSVFAASMLGGDSGGDADADSDMDGDMDSDGHGVGFSQLLSFKTIMAFFMGASWTGLSALYGGSSMFVVVLLSILAGALVMGATAFLIKSLMKLQHNSILTMDKALGQDGEVYYSIQPNMKRGGQVEILVNGAYKIFDAVTNDPEPIKRGDKVVVLDTLDGNLLLVGRLDYELSDKQQLSINN